MRIGEATAGVAVVTELTVGLSQAGRDGDVYCGPPNWLYSAHSNYSKMLAVWSLLRVSSEKGVVLHFTSVGVVSNGRQ